MRKLVRAAALMSLAITCVSAEAATLVVGAGGELTGANGVNVNGTFYDVAFVDGTCISLFSGCDEQSDFAFSDQAGADAAAQALLSQVFLNNQQGMFDSRPDLTQGCEHAAVCQSLIPYWVIDSFLFTSTADNASNENLDRVSGVLALDTDDFSTEPTRGFAVFTPAAAVSAVPEPTTWAMMIGGFFMVGAAMRGKKREQQATVSYT